MAIPPPTWEWKPRSPPTSTESKLSNTATRIPSPSLRPPAPPQPGSSGAPLPPPSPRRLQLAALTAAPHMMPPRHPPHLTTSAQPEPAPPCSKSGSRTAARPMPAPHQLRSQVRDGAALPGRGTCRAASLTTASASRQYTSRRSLSADPSAALCQEGTSGEAGRAPTTRGRECLAARPHHAGCSRRRTTPSGATRPGPSRAHPASTRASGAATRRSAATASITTRKPRARTNPTAGTRPLPQPPPPWLLLLLPRHPLAEASASPCQASTSCPRMRRHRLALPLTCPGGPSPVRVSFFFESRICARAALPCCCMSSAPLAGHCPALGGRGTCGEWHWLSQL